jgi:hydroxyacylglutathione hydrolase
VFIKQFKPGGDRNFSYLIADEKRAKAALIDPSYNAGLLVDEAEDQGLKILYIFNTHDHYDHTNGNEMAKSLTHREPLKFKDKDPLTGTIISDGATLPLGDLEIRVIHTPGHTPDSICLYVEDALFTGDTLFVGKVGGTDFAEQARQEYESLFKKVLALPAKTRVFPGHDYGTHPESTIEHEKKTNPFLLQPDFNSFVNLKRNWAQYKREHGIS